MKITGKSSVYCIFGRPVEHSFSPLIHNAAFQKIGMDSVYVAFEPQDLEQGVESLKNLGIQGASITIPFKIDIIPLLDEVDELAKNIGAVNTVVNKNQKLWGTNTDGVGALKALEEKTAISGKKIALLGFGGAARAIAFTLADKRPSEMIIWGLPEPGGKELADELSRKTGVKSRFEDVAKAVDYDILINCSPVGMWPEVDAMPIPDDFVLENRVVFDVIYRPKDTLLLKKAQAKGCEVVYGYKMLLFQGVEQFRLWTGENPPVEVMEAILTEQL